MKRLIATALLFLPMQLFAAITIVQSNFTLTSFTGVTSGTATGSLTNPVASGNAVLVAFAGAGNAAALSVGAVVDNKSNAYTQLTYDNTVTKGQGWFLATNITNAPNTSFSVPFTVASSTPTKTRECGTAE